MAASGRSVPGSASRLVVNERLIQGEKFIKWSDQVGDRSTGGRMATLFVQHCDFFFSSPGRGCKSNELQQTVIIAFRADFLACEQ